MSEWGFLASFLHFGSYNTPLLLVIICPSILLYTWVLLTNQRRRLRWASKEQCGNISMLSIFTSIMFGYETYYTHTFNSFLRSQFGIQWRSYFGLVLQVPVLFGFLRWRQAFADTSFHCLCSTGHSLLSICLRDFTNLFVITKNFFSCFDLKSLFGLEQITLLSVLALSIGIAATSQWILWKSYLSSSLWRPYLHISFMTLYSGCCLLSYLEFHLCPSFILLSLLDLWLHCTLLTRLCWRFSFDFIAAKAKIRLWTPA